MRGFALAETELTSFDRQVRMRCRVQRPDRYRLLAALPTDAPRIARGGGVSYVGASFGAGVISQDLCAFNRLLSFDDENGLLEVEAGASVGDVQRFALAHGWYLPVTPGHPRATLGGCVAADVHGKSPARHGSFREQVESFELQAADGSLRKASRERESALFAASFAGFGLSGTLTRLTLRLARPPGALVLRRAPVANLAEAAQVLREAANAPLLYGWHDGRPGHFGSGVIRIGLTGPNGGGNHGRTPDPAQDLPASIAPWPIALWNRPTIAFADAWLQARWCRTGEQTIGLEQALFPLNRARSYFAAYGRAGLAEVQWLVPHARFDGFAEALAALVARLRPRIVLIASKIFAGRADGLRFDGQGIALALHLPAPALPQQRAFLEALAELAIEHEGRPNLVKDSFLDAASVRRALPGFETARAELARFNPGGLLQSELTRRLAL